MHCCLYSVVNVQLYREDQSLSTSQHNAEKPDDLLLGSVRIGRDKNVTQVCICVNWIEFWIELRLLLRSMEHNSSIFNKCHLSHRVQLSPYIYTICIYIAYTYRLTNNFPLHLSGWVPNMVKNH